MQPDIAQRATEAVQLEMDVVQLGVTEESQPFHKINRISLDGLFVEATNTNEEQLDFQFEATNTNEEQPDFHCEATNTNEKQLELGSAQPPADVVASRGLEAEEQVVCLVVFIDLI